MGDMRHVNQLESMRAYYPRIVHRAAFLVASHVFLTLEYKTVGGRRSCTCHPDCGMLRTPFAQHACGRAHASSSKANSIWPAGLTWQHALSGQATKTDMLAHGQRVAVQQKHHSGCALLWQRLLAPLRFKIGAAEHCKQLQATAMQRVHSSSPHVLFLCALRIKSARAFGPAAQHPWRGQLPQAGAPRSELLPEERLQQLEVLRQLSRLCAGPQEPHAPQAARFELDKDAVCGAQAPAALLPHLHDRRELRLSSTVQLSAAACCVAVRRSCRALAAKGYTQCKAL